MPLEVMAADIFRESRQLQVGQAVIGIVAIDMMDYFATVQFPAQVLFHNFAVF